jgi:hypothetical protein
MPTVSWKRGTVFATWLLPTELKWRCWSSFVYQTYQTLV